MRSSGKVRSSILQKRALIKRLLLKKHSRRDVQAINNSFAALDQFVRDKGLDTDSFLRRLGVRAEQEVECCVVSPPGSPNHEGLFVFSLESSSAQSNSASPA